MKEKFLPPGVSVNTAKGYTWTVGPSLYCTVVKRTPDGYLRRIVDIKMPNQPLDVPWVCAQVDAIAPKHERPRLNQADGGRTQ